MAWNGRVRGHQWGEVQRSIAEIIALDNLLPFTLDGEAMGGMSPAM